MVEPAAPNPAAKSSISFMANKVGFNRSNHFQPINLGDILQEKNHAEILEQLQDIQLGDLCYCKSDPGKIQTVYGAILKHATNGDQIIVQKLDESVSRGGDENVNSIKSHIKVDLGPLIAKKSSKQTSIIKDLIDFKTPTTRALLTHPVIETFLDVKWRRVKKYFMANFIIYLLFLLAYSLFLGNIFYRQESEPVGNLKLSNLLVDIDRIVFPSEVDPGSNQFLTKKPEKIAANYSHSTFGTCGADPSLTCALEVVFVFFLIVLFTYEMFQLLVLGARRYLKELENWLELLIFMLAFFGLIFQSDLYAMKWISALGICLAYLELVFLLGRYPRLGGSISLMFYTITSHLFKTLLSFMVLVIGFAFGFFIMHHQSDNDNFENPIKAIFKTLVMALGELEFAELYSAHAGDKYALAFTLALLVGLIIMGSLVLLNLIIAIIVSDLGDLRRSSHIQGLVNKAQHIINVESALDSLCCILNICKPKPIPVEIQVCAHSQCSCNFRKLSPEIVDQLCKIVRRRQLMEHAGEFATFLQTNSATMSNILQRTSTMMRQTSFKPLAPLGQGGANSADIVQDILELLIEKQ